MQMQELGGEVAVITGTFSGIGEAAVRLLLMGLKGASPYIASDAISIADLCLAPIFDYVAMTPHKDGFLGRADFGAWWSAISGRDSFKKTPFGEG